MKADFAQDLAFGLDAERIFHSYLPRGWTRAGTERRWDFEHNDGRTLELKVERRPWDETQNVFFELEVNGKPGGPWRAHEDGVSLYVHHFPEPTPRSLVWSNVGALVECVEAWLAAAPRWVHNIRNRGFTGKGYAVPTRVLVGTAAPRVVWWNQV